MRNLDITNFPKNFGILKLFLAHDMKPTFENLLKTIAAIGTSESFDFVKDLRSEWLIDGNEDEKFDLIDVIEASMKFGRYQLFERFAMPIMRVKKKNDDDYEMIQSKIDSVKLELQNPNLPQCAYHQLERRLDLYKEMRDEFVETNNEYCFEWMFIVTCAFVYRDDFIGPKLIPLVKDFSRFERNFDRYGRIF